MFYLKNSWHPYRNSLVSALSNQLTFDLLALARSIKYNAPLDGFFPFRAACTAFFVCFDTFTV